MSPIKNQLNTLQVEYTCILNQTNLSSNIEGRQHVRPNIIERTQNPSPKRTLIYSYQKHAPIRTQVHRKTSNSDMVNLNLNERTEKITASSLNSRKKFEFMRNPRFQIIDENYMQNRTYLNNKSPIEKMRLQLHFRNRLQR